MSQLISETIALPWLIYLRREKNWISLVFCSAKAGRSSSARVSVRYDRCEVSYGARARGHSAMISYGLYRNIMRTVKLSELGLLIRLCVAFCGCCGRRMQVWWARGESEIVRSVRGNALLLLLRDLLSKCALWSYTTFDSLADKCLGIYINFRLHTAKASLCKYRYS